MRHISLDLIRVTEAAAIAASKWVGSGNKLLADKAATEAMRNRLNKIDFCAQIVIGEGKKDNSHGLYESEIVGKKNKTFWSMNPQTMSNCSMTRKLDGRSNIDYNIAVDPIDGTTPTVSGGPEAISVLAIAYPNSMYKSEDFYIDKIACGPKLQSYINFNLNENDLIKTVRNVLKRKEICVCVLDRPRHYELIETLRNLQVRIKLIRDCDISGAIATCLPNSGVDLYMGIGGTPEAVITAAAIKCLGGGFIVRSVKKVTNYKFILPSKHSFLNIDNLISGQCIFVATGITNGSILKGVENTTKGPVTHSVFMRNSSGTVRWIKTQHGN